MSGIDPSDPDAVRRRLDGLRSEFAGLGGGRLLRGVASLFRELFGLAGTQSTIIAALQDKLTEEVAKNSALRDQLARYERQQYGRSSEKRRNAATASEGGASDGAATPDAGEDEPETEKKAGKTTEKTAGKTPQGGVKGRTKDRGDAVNGAGLRFGPEATVIDIDVMPPEIEGLAADEFELISERVCCKLASVPVRHVVLRYHYKKAKIMSSGALVCAPAVEGVFKNSCADVTFIAGMLVDKFAWHLPLYRQHQMLAGSGITVNRKSLSGWANRAISLLEPVFEAQCRSVLDSSVIVMDETPVRVGRDPGKPGKMKQCYYWPVLGDRDEVVFHFAPSRAHHHVERFLGDFEGTLVSDGYGAYAAYAETRGAAVRQQNCWAYVAVIFMLRWPKKVRLDSGIAGISATFYFERHPNSVAGFPATTGAVDFGHPFFCSLPLARLRCPEAAQAPGCSHCRAAIAERRIAVSGNRDPGIGILPLTAT
ncbi:MAG: transposase [Gammaproteobacteria bacterium]|nr:transposase [Gammaproteobacteria bacterium]